MCTAPYVYYISIKLEGKNPDFMGKESLKFHIDVAAAIILLCVCFSPRNMSSSDIMRKWNKCPG